MPEQQPINENNKYLTQPLNPNGIVTGSVMVEGEDHFPAVVSYTIGAYEGLSRAFLVSITFIDQELGRELVFDYKQMYCVPSTIVIRGCFPNDKFVQVSQRVADDIMLRFAAEFAERYISDILPARKSQHGEPEADDA